ncbi:MAG: SCO family protein [Bacteroidetes bacterium]|nr:SCO family protein [Bacteroidota bacterium]
MKNYKVIILISVAMFAFNSCKENKDTNKNDVAAVYQCPMLCEGEKTYHKEGSCPVCNMDLKQIAENSSKEINNTEISEESIFNLTTNWNTEEGETIQLNDLKGKTLVMVMIYTTCKAACPRLVADMRNIEKQIPETNNLHYVLVSIDPETDTPKRLKEFAIENRMDGEQWTFLQGTENGVREFANVLAVKYKQISPMDFSHSNIISVFNTGGELIHQQEGLGVDNKETVSKILELIQ